jgi:hypothetical protein
MRLLSPQLGPGQNRLASHPNVRCDSDEHDDLRKAAYVFLTVWGAGLPFVLGSLLWRVWNENRYSVRNTSNFGILVRRPRQPCRCLTAPRAFVRARVVPQVRTQELLLFCV